MSEQVSEQVVEHVVDPETAAADFGRWVEAWGLDGDTATMEEEDRSSFEQLKRRLTRAISAGLLLVSEDAQTLEYKLINPQVQGLVTLTFSVPTGRALLGWDKRKERQAIHKMNDFMGGMCGTEPSVFVSMDGRDLKIAQAVAQLFLGS